MPACRPSTSTGWSTLLLGLLLLLAVAVVQSTRAGDVADAKALVAALTAITGDDERVILITAGETDAIQALLEQRNITADMIKRENNPIYYATKLVHRLRRYGELIMIHDHREQALDDVLHERFLDEHLVNLSQDFGPWTLTAVVNEFTTEAAPHNRIALSPVTRVNHVVTDLEVLPGDGGMLVATKRGDLYLARFDATVAAEPAVLLKLGDALEDQGAIHQVGESGLIGLALHPNFPTTPKLYLHYNVDLANHDRVARVASWTVETGLSGITGIDASSERVLLDIHQPASNHNGGALVFGKDGFLYIAVGDGEDGEWVKGRARAHGVRGKVLRIDIDQSDGDQAYAVPADNPLIDHPVLPPETFAWGFRNPWRLAFSPDGRLIAGDVGEDRYEEITEVVPGQHHGWPAMEGSWCRLQDACNPATSIGPLFQYGRHAGMSVTGGEVYEGEQIAWLQGAYVFADFSSGRIWSMMLPDGKQITPADRVTELGRWTVEFTTFAKADSGELYAGDLRGRIYQLTPLSKDRAQPSQARTDPKP